jgi:hypothetical protein
MSSSSNKSIGILIDELKSEDILCRIEAYKKLKTIAIALGPDKSVKELLLFLTCSLSEEEDELLVILAQHLSPDFYKVMTGEKSANATANHDDGFVEELGWSRGISGCSYSSISG